MDSLPTSAADARASGAMRYFTGKACKNGHVSTRLASNWACEECMAEFRRVNADSLKAYDRERNAQPERRKLKRQQEAALRRTVRLETPWRLCLRNTRRRAAKSGVEFSLTEDWAANNWTGSCTVTGLPFDLFHGTPYVHPMSPSIDRIDQSVGYVAGNCRFVLQCVNAFRSTMSDEQMAFIADRIASAAREGWKVSE